MNFIELFIKQICVVLTITLFFCNNIFAQDSIIDQDVRVNKQFWFDYNFTNSLTEALNISTQVGYRKITPKIYNRFLGISTLNIKNNKKLFNFEGDKPFIKSFHLGAGIIYTQNNNNNDNFELRLITELATNKSFETKNSGINPVLIGFKARLIEEKGIITKMRVKLAAKMLVIAWTLMKKMEAFNPDYLNMD